MSKKTKKAKTPRELTDDFVEELFKLGVVDTQGILDAVIPLLPRETVYVMPVYEWMCPSCQNKSSAYEMDDLDCDECGARVSLEAA